MFCWVSPHSQLLARQKNIYTYKYCHSNLCYFNRCFYFGHTLKVMWMRGKSRRNRLCYGTCFWPGLRDMVGGSNIYVVAWVSCWNWNWTSASRPELLSITSLSVFSGYLFSLYLHMRDKCKSLNQGSETSGPWGMQSVQLAPVSFIKNVSTEQNLSFGICWQRVHLYQAVLTSVSGSSE